MEISNFKAGKSVQQIQYKSLEPNIINVQWQMDVPELTNLLSQADRILGETML